MMNYNHFLEMTNELSLPVVQSYFNIYSISNIILHKNLEEINWSMFFSLYTVFSFLRYDVAIKLIIIVSGIKYSDSIPLSDVILLLHGISSTSFINIIEEESKTVESYTLTNLIETLVGTPKALQLLDKFRYYLSHLVFSKFHIKEILKRRKKIIYRNKYFMKNHRYPSECCLSSIIRLLMNKPYPYQYDYEVDPSNERKKINILIEHYKQIISHVKSANYRLLHNVVKDSFGGDLCFTDKISVNSEYSKGQKYQNANMASCSRSKPNSTVSFENEPIPPLIRTSIKINGTGKPPEKLERLKINGALFQSSAKNIDDNRSRNSSIDCNIQISHSSEINHRSVPLSRSCNIDI